MDPNPITLFAEVNDLDLYFNLHCSEELDYEVACLFSTKYSDDSLQWEDRPLHHGFNDVLSMLPSSSASLPALPCFQTFILLRIITNVFARLQKFLLCHFSLLNGYLKKLAWSTREGISLFRLAAEMAIGTGLIATFGGGRISLWSLSLKVSVSMTQILTMVIVNGSQTISFHFLIPGSNKSGHFSKCSYHILFYSLLLFPLFRGKDYSMILFKVSQSLELHSLQNHLKKIPQTSAQTYNTAIPIHLVLEACYLHMTENLHKHSGVMISTKNSQNKKKTHC